VGWEEYTKKLDYIDVIVPSDIIYYYSPLGYHVGIISMFHVIEAKDNILRKYGIIESVCGKFDTDGGVIYSVANHRIVYNYNRLNRRWFIGRLL
jgi:hypothetical protein